MTATRHIVSVSGDKDSTALYLKALERGRPFDAVFADTGHEHPEVYAFIARLPGLTGGPAVRTVKADFTERMAKRRLVIATKWRAEGVPEAKVEMALSLLHPTGIPFLDLCMWKGRFPSSQARFCTEELKVEPIMEQVYRPAFAEGARCLVSWQGVRAQESRARAMLQPWQRLMEQGGRCYAYRPLLKWTLEDVWAIHARHGIARNPLYDAGLTRVGCMPCIMASKDEIRTIAARFPEEVDRVEQWERLVSEVSKPGRATLFAATSDPLLKDKDSIATDTHGIRRKVEWSRTSRGGSQFSFLLDPAVEFGTACSQWGTCEA